MEDVPVRLVNEGDLTSVNWDETDEHLSRVIEFPTLAGDTPESTDWAPFEAQRAYLEEAYPAVFDAAEVSLHGPEGAKQSLMLRLPGSDPSLKPVAFLAHQDVVPVVPGTEDDWTHPAFSGAIADGYIWGRGTLDMKGQLIAVLEAAEYWLSQEIAPARTVYLLFGQDEETAEAGAAAMAADLAADGVELAWLIDEGESCLLDGSLWGAKDASFVAVDIAEKGYLDVELSTESQGGHSSDPGDSTSLGRLAEAIFRITSASWGPRLTAPIKAQLRAMNPYMTDPAWALMTESDEALDLNEVDLAKLIQTTPGLAPYVVTTVAPTMIEGGATAPNVLPQFMRCVVNFRLLFDTTVSEVLDRMKELVQDLDVTVRMLPGDNDPVSSDGIPEEPLSLIRDATKRYWRNPTDGAMVPVVPSSTLGATDAGRYADVCQAPLRFMPFVVSEEERNRGIHGTDERIPLDVFHQGIRIFIRIMGGAFGIRDC